MHGTDIPAADIIIVLHAHLPYIRNTAGKISLQELWLFQAITECYIPLIRCLNGLNEKNINFNITLSVSPTLLSMLDDDCCKTRYRDYVRMLIKLMGRILKGSDDKVKPFMSRLMEKTEAISDYYDNINGDIINELKRLSRTKRVNLITTSATHSILPLYRHDEYFVSKQVDAGLALFENKFGFSPEGFWLPEMAYYSGLDSILLGRGIKYTFLDAHSVYLSNDDPSCGNFYPAVTENGLAIFPREIALSNIIWAASTGYPGDYRYREFHYDYTYSLSDELLAEVGADRIPLGLKIYRITGGDAPKDFYDINPAMAAVEDHSDDFIRKIHDRAGEVGSAIGRTPVFTLPFDAELFGHWWHEGPEFLERIITKISSSGGIRLISPAETPGDPLHGRVRPAESSWGDGGYFKVWLNPKCSGLYPQIADLCGRLYSAPEESLPQNAARRAFREILLAASSDWVFFIANNSSADYGRMRLNDHMNAAERIIKSIEEKNIDEQFLSERETRYPIFDDIEL